MSTQESGKTVTPPTQEGGKKVDYRSMMSSQPSGSDKYHLGDPLITTSAKDLHIRSRITSVGLFNMSVHSLISASVQREANVVNAQNVVFDMKTLAGRMAFFQFEYEALSPAVDGMARDQYAKVASLAAIGSNDDEGRIASQFLNEGSKQLSNKNKER